MAPTLGRSPPRVVARSRTLSENLIAYHQKPDELAHYARATVDILYKFPHGTEELEGVANRTDFDLGSHSKNNADLGLTAKVEKIPTARPS